jgi:hypothetical protein
MKTVTADVRTDAGAVLIVTVDGTAEIRVAAEITSDAFAGVTETVRGVVAMTR